jgi:hypothetical protein
MNFDEELKHGLVAHYKMRGNANDSSRFLNHGTVNGATLTTDRFGRANSAYAFDGVNDFINLGNVTSFAQGGAGVMSLTFWLNHKRGNKDIISKYSSASQREFRIVAYENHLSAEFYSLNGLNYIVSTLDTNTVLQNTNQFISLEYNVNKIGNERISWVVNETTYTPSISGSGTFVGLGAGISPLYIGGNPSLNNYMNITISDFRIYNRILSVPARQKLYRSVA